MIDLLVPASLPDEFEYPAEFLRVVELGIINLEPWLVLGGEQLVVRHHGLRERYPERSLVPFARRQDNDDVACFDLQGPRGGVAIIHDFASWGWEGRNAFPDFYSWLKRAIEDLIEFG